MFEHNYVVFERRNIYLYSSLCNPSLKNKDLPTQRVSKFKLISEHIVLNFKIKKKNLNRRIYYV